MDLNNISLLELQSKHMQDDIVVQALCETLQPYFQKLANDTKLAYIYGRIDELNEEILDELAWQFHVDYYENSLSIEKKRELIKNSMRWHRIKGTPEAVEKVSNTVFGRTKLKEWFEYGGNPYYFSMDIDITDRGASPQELVKLDDLINAYKNTRSWVDVLNIYYSVKGPIYYSLATIQGESMTVYPWSPKDIESKGNIDIPMIESRGVEELIVYPKN